MVVSSSFCLLQPYHSCNEAKGCFLEIEMLLLSCSGRRFVVVERTGEEKSEERAINNVARRSLLLVWWCVEKKSDDRAVFFFCVSFLRYRARGEQNASTTSNIQLVSGS